VVARQPCCHVQPVLELGQWLCVPRFHVVCLYQAMAPQGHRAWEGGKRCARDRAPIVVAVEMGFRESVCGEGERAGPTYPAKRCGVASAQSLPWNSGLYATLSMPDRAKVDHSSVQHRIENLAHVSPGFAERMRMHIHRMSVGVTRFVWTMASVGGGGVPATWDKCYRPVAVAA
jgi:hypothetical protein